jgi:Domain of unknown function (DUF4381)
MNRRGAALLLALFATRLSVAQTPAPAPAAATRVQGGIALSKDTVTVGERFDVRVRVRAPADADIRFPDNPDTTGTVQARDPRSIVVGDSINSNDQTAVYHVAAWDVGMQRILLGPVVVTWQGRDRPVAVGQAQVFVRSVLPADSALRVPKPARPLWEPKPFPWWLVALIAAALLIALGIWWWRRRRRRGPQAVVVVDPYVRAQREFARIEAMRLLEADERTRFAALNVEVLRDYLAARYPDASLALTSRELVTLLRNTQAISIEQLSRALHEADLAKFAAWTLTEERARALARDARDIVAEDHAAAQAAASAQAVAA